MSFFFLVELFHLDFNAFSVLLALPPIIPLQFRLYFSIDSVRFVLIKTHAILSKHAKRPQKQRRHGNTINITYFPLESVGLLSISISIHDMASHVFLAFIFLLCWGGGIIEKRSCGRSEIYFESINNQPIPWPCEPSLSHPVDSVKYVVLL